ncbi:hypothetical protein CDEST_14099 [Colletotrichum destructivum]|uniref:Uncharacterized protein n=1 Tax=Colletotrichum destructivum TaxID=34406 RepID=A0AAX4J0Z8_9PEZI|nr:hypothetical protein CDEST_14099 [Colletotrichum destructivum]
MTTGARAVHPSPFTACLRDKVLAGGWLDIIGECAAILLFGSCATPPTHNTPTHNTPTHTSNPPPCESASRRI